MNSSNDHLRQWQDKTGGRLNWTYVIVLAGMLALILGRLTTSTADPDLWGYLAFGRLFWNQAGFPYHDIYAYTPTKEFWVYHEWLTGVIFYPLYVGAGPASLQILKYILGLGTAILIFMAARQRGAWFPATLTGLLLCSPFFGFAYSPVRAQAFTQFFFVLTLFVLERSKDTGSPKPLLWLLPIFPLWANLHGGFIAGLGLIGIYAAGSFAERRKAGFLWLVLGFSAALTLINPYGIKYWVYLADAVTMPRPDIDEWQSVIWALKNGEYSTNSAYFLFLMAFAIAIIVVSRRLNVADILLLVATGYLAFRHLRHQSLFFMAVGCLLPVYLTDAWQIVEKSPVSAERWARLTRVLAPVIFSLSICIFGFRFISGSPFTLQTPSHSDHPAAEYNYPVSAVKYLRSAGLQGNMISEFDWGEYVIWELDGNCRVAMDGRYETVYPEDVSRKFFEFVATEQGWRGFLEKYPPDLVLLRPSSPVGAILGSEPGWKQAYSDADSVLFVMDKNKSQ